MANYKTGEYYAKQCLAYNDFQVIDRTEDNNYWIRDIDFTAIKDNRTFEIEVKYDTRISKSNNLYLELIPDIQKNKLGWAQYTEADIIFYGDANNLIFYVFAVDDMRRFLNEHKEKYETRIATDYNYHDGSIYKQSVGAVVPLPIFKQYVNVQIIDIRERLNSYPNSKINS